MLEIRSFLLEAVDVCNALHSLFISVVLLYESLFNFLRVAFHLIESTDDIVAFMDQIGQSDLLGDFTLVLEEFIHSLQIYINLVCRHFRRVPHEKGWLSVSSLESLLLFSLEVKMPKIIYIFPSRKFLGLVIETNFDIYSQ